MWLFYATENIITWTKMSRLATKMGVNYGKENKDRNA
jgi:hypothetical protein